MEAAIHAIYIADAKSSALVFSYPVGSYSELTPFKTIISEITEAHEKYATDLRPTDASQDSEDTSDLCIYGPDDPEALASAISSALPVISTTSGKLIFQQTYRHQLQFFVETGPSADAAVPLDFISRFITVLEDYFGFPVTTPKIEHNYDTVNLVLLEMLDAGFPYLTDPNPLRDIASRGSIFTKLLSSTAPGAAVAQAFSATKSVTSSDASAAAQHAHSGKLRNFMEPSAYPWRRSNVRHANNELFVDIVETLHLTVASGRAATRAASSATSASAFYSTVGSASGRTVACRIEGEIYFTSHLSGTPEIQLNLSIPDSRLRTPGGAEPRVALFQHPSLHACVRADRWASAPGTLNFVPPEGRSLLAAYTVEPELRSAAPGLVHVSLKTGLGLAGDEFEVHVATTVSRYTKEVENLRLEIQCDVAQCTGVRALRLTGGDSRYLGNGVCEWVLDGKRSLGWTAVFRGIVETEAEQLREEEEEEEIEEEEEDVKEGKRGKRGKKGSSTTGLPSGSRGGSRRTGQTNRPAFPKFVCASYECRGSLFSGIRVDSLKLVSTRGMSEGVRPYKGVKYISQVGDYIVR